MPFDLAAPLVTVEDVIRLREERDRVGRELVRLKQEYEAADGKLQGIALWLPAEVREQILGPVTRPSAEEEPTRQPEPADTIATRWARVLIPLLESKGHALTTMMIRREIKGQPIEEEIGFQGRTLHRAVTNLAASGELVRDGDFYGLPGQRKPEGVSVTGSLSEQFRESILRHLREADAPQLPSEIKSGLSDDDLRDAVRTKGNLFYNAIGKLLSDGRIQKVGEAYRLPPKKNELPSVRPLGSSGAASVSD